MDIQTACADGITKSNPVTYDTMCQRPSLIVFFMQTAIYFKVYMPLL